jgi:predicted nucleic acid-binding protein
MILVDTSCWIEYFTNGPLKDKVKSHIEETETLLVPTIVLYELYKKIKLVAGEENALKAVGTLKTGTVVDLDENLSLLAADMSLEYKLPMADAIIFATATIHRAKIVTSDEHFKTLPNVVYYPKTKSS